MSDSAAEHSNTELLLCITNQHDHVDCYACLSLSNKHAQPAPGLAGVLVSHALLGLSLLYRQLPESGRLHSISMAPTEVQICSKYCSLPFVVYADTDVQAVTLTVITTAADVSHLCLDA